MKKFRCTGNNCESCILPDCLRPTVNLYGNIEFVNILGRWRKADSNYAKRHEKDADKYIEIVRPDGSRYFKSLAKIEYDREYQRKRYQRIKEA